MNPKGIVILCAVLALSGPAPAPAADPPAGKGADERFERLLTAARKDPERADWKALRRAFAETSRYAPYNIDVDEKLKAIAAAIDRGEWKESEAPLLNLIERERFMRIHALGLLVMLYENREDREKAATYGKLLDAIHGVLDYPKAGVSFKNPIEVLFIQEEYLVTAGMPVKGQALAIKDGHRFDILTIKADDDQPERKVYFNVDLPRKAMAKFLDPK